MAINDGKYGIIDDAATSATKTDDREILSKVYNFSIYKTRATHVQTQRRRMMEPEKCSLAGNPVVLKFSKVSIDLQAKIVANLEA